MEIMSPFFSWPNWTCFFGSCIIPFLVTRIGHRSSIASMSALLVKTRWRVLLSPREERSTSLSSHPCEWCEERNNLFQMLKISECSAGGGCIHWWKTSRQIHAIEGLSRPNAAWSSHAYAVKQIHCKEQMGGISARTASEARIFYAH